MLAVMRSGANHRLAGPMASIHDLTPVRILVASHIHLMPVWLRAMVIMVIRVPNISAFVSVLMHNSRVLMTSAVV